ncbi:MAG TPA: POTRA domain-containing protein [Bryobacteraceae bacterium]|nr:POTRA domain-containing protein [Bryobacteraceae bacterium]
MLRISLVSLAFAAALGAQNFPIDSITIEGNRILSSPAIIAASGLRRGAPGNASVFDEARDRLLASGYFDSVAYSYKPATAGGGYDITYEVKEVNVLFPVRIEGLGATSDEITGVLKTKDPLFTGRMPGTQQVIAKTSREIEEYLKSKGHPGQVTGKVIAVAPEKFEVQFTPVRGLPAVNFISFEGSKAIPAIDLHNKISEVAYGQPFTEDGFRVLLQNQITPLYEAKGYMKVTYPKIVTSPAADVAGLDVKVTVDEGAEYKLSRVAVFGKSPEESERILKTAKLPKLTIANFDEIKQAAGRVQETMRKSGYLDARVTTDKKIDDAQKTVAFFLVVETGAQYTFGKLNVNGLGLDGEAAIRKIWSVKTGDSFPAGYPDYFLGKVKDEGLFDNLGATTAKSDINPDTHVVDVTLDFKGAPAKPRKPRTGPIPF